MEIKLTRGPKASIESSQLMILGAIMISLVGIATVALFLKLPLNQPMDYVVAVGTTLLAFMAFLTIIDSKRSSAENIQQLSMLVTEMQHDREIQHIRFQIDDLYMPIMSCGNESDAFFEPNDGLFNRIKQKKYLAEKDLEKALDGYVRAREQWEAQKQFVEELADTVEDESTKEGLEQKKAKAIMETYRSSMAERSKKVKKAARKDFETLEKALDDLLSKG